MNSMKTKHVYIVQEIEKHYRAIEDETQVTISLGSCKHSKYYLWALQNFDISALS